MTDELHEELLFCDFVSHDHLVVENRVRVALDYLVLRKPAGKPLTLANEKVNGCLHLLIAQKVDLSVALLHRKSKAVVPPHLAEILVIRGVEGADRACAQIMTYRAFTFSVNARTLFIR